MDYRDRLSEIFEGKGPSSLRMIFDNGSKEWQNVTIAKKVWYLEKMISTENSFEYWINEYIDQHKSSHKHIISAIKPSLGFLSNHILDKKVKLQINAWIENN